MADGGFSQCGKLRACQRGVGHVAAQRGGEETMGNGQLLMEAQRWELQERMCRSTEGWTRVVRVIVETKGVRTQQRQQ